MLKPLDHNSHPEYFKPLINELNRWLDEDLTATFWWRDDDAITYTQELDTLCFLSHQYNIPLSLAVIPKHLDMHLAQDIQKALGTKASNISILQHGYSHDNYAPSTEKKHELGNHRPHDVILSELSQGYQKLNNCFGKQFAPIIVPPWNRMDNDVIASVLESDHSFLGVSQMGAPTLAEKIAHEKLEKFKEINIHVDILNFKDKNNVKFAGNEQVVQSICHHLSMRRENKTQANIPTGIMTHHLVHDQESWNFLHELFTLTRESMNCRWLSISEIT